MTEPLYDYWAWGMFLDSIDRNMPDGGNYMGGYPDWCRDTLDCLDENGIIKSPTHGDESLEQFCPNGCNATLTLRHDKWHCKRCGEECVLHPCDFNRLLEVMRSAGVIDDGDPDPYQFT